MRSDPEYRDLRTPSLAAQFNRHRQESLSSRPEIRQRRGLKIFKLYFLSRKNCRFPDGVIVKVPFTGLTGFQIPELRSVVDWRENPVADAGSETTIWLACCVMASFGPAAGAIVTRSACRAFGKATTLNVPVRGPL